LISVSRRWRQEVAIASDFWRVVVPRLDLPNKECANLKSSKKDDQIAAHEKAKRAFDSNLVKIAEVDAKLHLVNF